MKTIAMERPTVNNTGSFSQRHRDLILIFFELDNSDRNAVRGIQKWVDEKVTAMCDEDRWAYFKELKEHFEAVTPLLYTTPCDPQRSAPSQVFISKMFRKRAKK